MVIIMECVAKAERESDHVRFSRMAREHSGMLLAYAQTLLQDQAEARDLVQDALVAAWTNLKRFDVTRDTGAWLRGIVRNKWRDHCRKKGMRPQFTDRALEELEDDLRAWEVRADGGVMEALRTCRDKLPAPLAEAVQVFYYDELSGEEAAARLGINAATVRKRLERARQALHECLKRII